MMKSKIRVNIIGAGLAGVEACHFLSKTNLFDIHLFEMRPNKSTPAHHTSYFGELVCSNSLKSNELDNACGLLKEEMRAMDSITMKVAEEAKVPGGSSLSVDREIFGKKLTDYIKSLDNVQIHYEEVTSLDDNFNIVATGPLTSDPLVLDIKRLTGQESLSFFDASSPIIYKDSIDMNVCYFKSRYDKGDASYINCPFTKEEYYDFVKELCNAKIAKLHSFDTEYFESCMPIEVMANRGVDTLRYGPLKPKGLWKNSDDHSYAVLQLRQDSVAADLYNIVGFQTNLTFPEQKRVFSLIPGLKNAKFARYGLMHRNTYINAPKVLKENLELINKDKTFVCGQLCGVEGYVESAASGIYAAISLYLKVIHKEKTLKTDTMLGCLMHYVTHSDPQHFQPMNANFGIMYNTSKKNRQETIIKSLESIKKYYNNLDD